MEEQARRLAMEAEAKRLADEAVPEDLEMMKKILTLTLLLRPLKSLRKMTMTTFLLMNRSPKKSSPKQNTNLLATTTLQTLERKRKLFALAE